MEKTNVFYKGKLYYTTDGNYNNIMYIESFYSYVFKTIVHVFEDLNNKRVRLYDKEIGENYEVYLDI